MIATIANQAFPHVNQPFFSIVGGNHQAKAGQGPQEDPGAQGQISC